MAIIPAKQIGGSVNVADVETSETARVPGEVGDGQAAVVDRYVLGELRAIHVTLTEIRDLLMEIAK